MKNLDLTLVYLIRKDEVLLAMKKRGFGMGRWNGAGGKVESNETIEQAMIRETQEEIFVTPTDYHKVAQLKFDERHGGERKIMNISVYFATQWVGEPKESEEMRPKWHNIDNLPVDDMWPADKIWLPVALSGQKLRGTFKLDETDQVSSKNINIVKEL